MTHLTWSEQISKRIRSGEWNDQAVSTIDKIEEALSQAGGELGLSSGGLEEAAQLVDYFMEEAKICYMIYKVWLGGFLEWLELQGVTEAERDQEVTRLRKLLAWPSGEPFDPVAKWEALSAAAGRIGNRIRSGDLIGTRALNEVDALREDWRRLHDRYVDLISGILAYVARCFGEPRLEDCYRHVLEPYIAERYMPFDVRTQSYEKTLFRNLYLAFEAMRGHLCGPRRRGDIEFEEHGDRFVLRFDPCGSGGRTLRGDPAEGTRSRILAPYEFGVTQQKYDWAWNKEGICYYCAHCCFALERLPAERWGHPVRVVDPPIWGGEGAPATSRKCQWTIYKSLDAIPKEAYERIGLRKPPANGLEHGTRKGTTTKASERQVGIHRRRSQRRQGGR